MTFLIVDDEYYSVESLVHKLHAHVPADTIILCAYNKQQALEHFQKSQIDIMICDVEMPGGTGLELLEEIRQMGSDVVCLFLTAYDRFEYISKAMKLSSIDYLLKPIDAENLKHAVDQAIQKVHQLSESRRYRQESTYWKNSELYITESIIQNILKEDIPSESSEITYHLKLRNLPENQLSGTYLPVLLQCIPENTSILDRNQFDFILKNILREVFYETSEIPCVIKYSSTMYFLLPDQKLHKKEHLSDRCHIALKYLKPYFQESFNFYLPEDSCEIEKLCETAKSLITAAKRIVNISSQVFDLGSMFRPNPAAPSELPLSQWKEYLQRRKFDILKESLFLYLTELQRQENVHQENLIAFFYEVSHLFSSHLQDYAPDSVSLFQSEWIHFHEHDVFTSFHALKDWTEHMLLLTEQCLEAVGNTNEAVLFTKDYIASHLSEDMTRDSLASMVYLNADYLSHLFKKETGLSLTNFIINERIQKSRELLSHTNMSIRDIAIACGFQNVSYFSKQFRKATGVSPRDFRN